MIKVVIADDEARVCQLIQALADWDSLGMAVVGTAHNGIDALELIQREQPDIVITDIRMPGCSGLELIERAHAINDSTDFVIISGHAHFEYAQTAIKFGVGDYLLKPINREALMATLGRLREKHLASSARHALTAKLIHRSRCDLDKLRASLFFDVLLTEPPAAIPERERLNEEYHYALGMGQLRAFVLKADFEREEYNDEALTVLEERARELLRGGLRGCCVDAELCFRSGMGYGLCSYAPERGAEVRCRLKDAMDRLLTQGALFPGLVFTLGLGSAVDDVRELGASLSTALEAVEERILEGGGRVLEQVPPTSALDSAALLEEFSRAVGDAVELLDPDAATAAAALLVQRACAVPGICGRELLALVREAGHRMTVLLGGDTREPVLSGFLRDCALSGNVVRLSECLTTLVSALMKALCEERRQANTRPIRLAKQFIKEHYMEPITLEQVSDAAGFNASYFSALFKKETGVGFLEYLSETRIDQAKELLRETSLSVAEICTRVGYNDGKHFTKTFTKYTSLKPGEFRKLYG